MNNNENENNKDNLSAVSLGSVDNTNSNVNVPINDIPPVTPIPEEEPVETLDVSGVEAPVVQNTLTPEVQAENQGGNINTIPTDIPPLEPVAPINYDIPEVIDNTPIFNDIGTVPPIVNNDVIIKDNIAEPAEATPKKKKGMNKTLFVVLIMLALVAVGGGVYILLKKADDKKPVVITKKLKIERGGKVSSDIKDYATFKNVDSSTCNFDTTEITDTSTLGAEYKFRVTCGNSTYIGKATIVDTTAPEVTTREVNIGINEDVTAEDFIAECKDASKCTYTFKEEEKIKEHIKEVASYHVPIIVKDEAGNEKEVTGILNVNETVSTVSLVCTKTTDDYLLTEKFGLDETTFNKSTLRSYTFTFESKEEYEKVRDENKDKEEITYLNVTGKPVFDDVKMTLVISKRVSYSELNEEVGEEVPLPFGELKLFFEKKDYTCGIGY